MAPPLKRQLALILLLALLTFGCERVRSLVGRGSLPTPTPSWVGKIQEEATPVTTFQSRVADTDSRTGARLGAVTLRNAPGRGSDTAGAVVQPGERIFIVGLDTVGGERFFKVRSFDGLRRGWLPESTTPVGERP